MKHLYLSLFLLFFFVASSNGQNKIPLLERTITIRASGEKVTSVLTRIGQEAGFSFSYNSSIISSEQTVTLNLTQKSVRDVLNEIFGGSMNYKEKSNYLILTRAPLPPVKNNVTQIIVNGYVEDKKTGLKIPNASVYDKHSITSAVTDEYGYFKLRLEKKQDSILLSVSKKNYYDTLVSITDPSNQYFTIAMRPVELDIATVKTDVPVVDSVVAEKKEEFVMPYESEPNVQNIRDTLHRLVQVSFLPFIGTNDRLSGNVINDYSINFLGGYSMGTKQIELGFFFNIDRADVSWLQIGGFGNLVGRDMYGIQMAGFFNANGGEVKAIQLAGFSNTNLGESIGVQVAGFANANLRSMNGVQVAGFGNYSNGKSRGVQVAGVTNVHLGDYYGSQVAGLTNINTGKITGSQTAGFFNYGRKVNGTQIGLINYADSLGGVPIGLFSIVNRGGYHKVEVSADEVFYTNLAFRTGVRKFYTILQAGFKPDQSFNQNDTSVWSFGYGLGTSRKITRWWYLDFDVTAQHVNKGSFTNALSLLNKFYVGFDFQVAKKFSIATGVTLNGYLTRSTHNEYPVMFTDYKPNVFYDRIIDRDVNLKMWLGGKVALRFL